MVNIVPTRIIILVVFWSDKIFMIFLRMVIYLDFEHKVVYEISHCELIGVLKVSTYNNIHLMSLCQISSNT